MKNNKISILKTVCIGMLFMLATGFNIVVPSHHNSSTSGI